MKKQKRIFVLTIFVACISLVVLLTGIVNADEYVTEVIEFVGTSNSSFEDATLNAVLEAEMYRNTNTEMILILTREAMNEHNEEKHHNVDLFVELTEDENEIVKISYRARIRMAVKMKDGL